MIRLFTTLILFSFSAAATTYTVKSGGGGNYTTIQSCASAAIPGDTCVVYAGSYSGWTQSTNGNSGNRITFKATPGDLVTITSSIGLSSRSYVTIGGPGDNEGFQITGGISFSNTSRVVIQNNKITKSSGSCMSGSTSTSSQSSYVSFLNNTIGPCGGGASETLYVQGHHFLFDGNTFTRMSNGPNTYGSFHVYRNNHFGPIINGEAGSEHPDAVEHTCYGDLALQHLLYENNTTQDWVGSNSHGFLLRNTDGSGTCANPGFNVIRFSRFINMGSGMAQIETNMPGIYVYNNSISNTQTAFSTKPRQDVSWYDNSLGGRAINNIIANTTSNQSPWCIDVGSDSKAGFVEHHNLCWNSGYSGSWTAPSSGAYSSTDKFNLDPKFLNGMNDLHLQAGSPAIGAGGALTSVAAADTGSGTTLVVTDAGFFQDGYGIDGVQPDCIRVGASATVQIASINYSTNTITLASSISRSDGDGVFLYKDSGGNVVLTGTNPEIGAYPYGQGSSGGSVNEPMGPATRIH